MFSRLLEEEERGGHHWNPWAWQINSHSFTFLSVMYAFQLKSFVSWNVHPRQAKLTPTVLFCNVCINTTYCKFRLCWMLRHRRTDTGTSVSVSKIIAVKITTFYCLKVKNHCQQCSLMPLCDLAWYSHPEVLPLNLTFAAPMATCYELSV